MVYREKLTYQFLLVLFTFFIAQAVVTMDGMLPPLFLRITEAPPPVDIAAHGTGIAHSAYHISNAYGYHGASAGKGSGCGTLGTGYSNGAGSGALGIACNTKVAAHGAAAMLHHRPLSFINDWMTMGYGVDQVGLCAL